MNYYLLENNEASGPYSKLDLRMKRIRPDTLVCPEDAKEWKQAVEIEDLHYLFPDVEKPKRQEPPVPETPVAPPEPETIPESQPTPIEPPVDPEPLLPSATPEETPVPQPEPQGEPDAPASGDTPQEPEQAPKGATPVEEEIFSPFEQPPAKLYEAEPPKTQPESEQKPKITVRPAGKKEAVNKPQHLITTTPPPSNPLVVEPRRVQPEDDKKPERIPPPAPGKNKTLREKLLSSLNSLSTTALWGQLVKWKWYIAAFAAVLLGAWLFTAVAEWQREARVRKALDLWLAERDSIRREEIRQDSIRRDSIRREEEKKKDPAYIIASCTDMIQQHETRIVELERQISELETQEKTERDSLRNAQKDFKGKKWWKLEKKETYENRKKDFQENTVKPLQAKIDDSVQKIKQKNAEIKTLRQEIDLLKQRIREAQSAVENEGKNE